MLNGAAIRSVPCVPSNPSIFILAGLAVVAGTLISLVLCFDGFPGVSGVPAVALDRVFAGIPVLVLSMLVLPSLV